MDTLFAVSYIAIALLDAALAARCARRILDLSAEVEWPLAIVLAVVAVLVVTWCLVCRRAAWLYVWGPTVPLALGTVMTAADVIRYGWSLDTAVITTILVALWALKVAVVRGIYPFRVRTVLARYAVRTIRARLRRYAAGDELATDQGVLFVVGLCGSSLHRGSAASADPAAAVTAETFSFGPWGATVARIPREPSLDGSPVSMAGVLRAAVGHRGVHAVSDEELDDLVWQFTRAVPVRVSGDGSAYGPSPGGSASA